MGKQNCLWRRALARSLVEVQVCMLCLVPTGGLLAQQSERPAQGVEAFVPAAIPPAPIQTEPGVEPVASEPSVTPLAVPAPQAAAEAAATPAGRDGSAPPSPATIAEPSATDPAEAAAGPAAAPSTDALGNPTIPAEAAAEDSPPTPLKPQDLSPWGMFMAADIVVKAVMIGLAIMSVLTWTVWIAKSLELAAARRTLRKAVASLSQASSLADAAQRIQKGNRTVRVLVEQADLELRLSADVIDKAGSRDRVATRLQGVVASAGRAMNRGTGVLATIGSTAPFIGLFGTVWGIMNSFIGISKSQTTNLAVVAPGIAEALLATAIGLVAAIPAVIIYNQFARSISAYKAQVGEAAAEVMRHVSRDLDRGIKIHLVKAAAE
jgi:biopolymer transport protein ExbB